MSITPSQFARLAHSHFDYLERDFQFNAKERIAGGWGAVVYDSPRVAIEPGWEPRDGAYLSITAKADTFWIRPASSHHFFGANLLEMLAPEVLKEEPKCTVWEGITEGEAESWLAFWGHQLRVYGEPLLRGDLGLCEDMLISSYCNTTKGWSLDDYYKVFREECACWSREQQEKLEAAMATRAARPVYFLIHECQEAGALGSRRLSTTLNDFCLQYMQ